MEEEWTAAYQASAKRLRWLRDRSKLSRRQLSIRTGISYEVLQHAEHATGKVLDEDGSYGWISVKTALRLAPHLNCTPAYILFGI